MAELVEFPFTEVIGGADFSTADEAAAGQALPELWVCPLVGIGFKFISIPDNAAAVEYALDVRAIYIVTVSDAFHLELSAVFFVVVLSATEFLFDLLQFFFVCCSVVFLGMLVWPLDDVPS